MKTTNQTTRPFPKPARFSLYVCAVAVLCFFNWVALQAQGPVKSLESCLAEALIEEAEPAIELQAWMLAFSEEFLAVEEEIRLEPWMLTLSDDFAAGREPEIELESWMLSFSEDHLANSEPDLLVEDWMTETFLWDTAFLMAGK